MANDKKNPLSGAFHDPEPPKDAKTANKPVEPAKTVDAGKTAAAPAKADEMKKPTPPEKAADAPKDKAASDKTETEKKAAEPAQAADAGKAAAAPAKADEVKKPAAPDKTADAPKDKAAPTKPEAEKKAEEPVKTADFGKAAAAPAKAEEVKKPAAPDKTADAPKDKSAPTKPEAGKKAAEPVKAADADKPAAAPAKAEEVKKPATPDKTADAPKDKSAPTKPEAEKKAAEPEKAADAAKTAAAPAKAEEVKKPTEAGKAPSDGKAAEEKSDALDPKHMQMPMGVAEMDKVTIMPLADIHRFDGHPFKVEDNKDMWDLVESIKQFGVMEPAVVIPRKEGGYEMVSGHRRQRACQLAGLTSMPVIVRNLDRDEATITMVDANLKRENISPMEKARAYEMKLEAMKRKAGRRSKMDILSGEKPMRADEQLAQQVGESRATIQRYTRLTKLEPELQEMVDEKKLPVNTAADISYLKPDEQKKLADAMKREDKVPSGTQAAELKKESQAGKLTAEKIEKTVAPTKREENPELKVTFTNDELRPYFPKKDTTVGDVKRVVFESLTLRQKAMERQQVKAAPDNKKQRSKPDLAIVK